MLSAHLDYKIETQLLNKLVYAIPTKSPLLQLNCVDINPRLMIRYSDIKKVLKAHKLRVTAGRIDILEFFHRQNRTLSFKDLEDEFKDSDRVTLYRTLNAFTDKGVLHKIPDDSGFATYGLCHDACDSEDHNHDHMHFKCNECGTIECLEQNIPTVKIPGYKVTEANLILKGICKTCAA